MLAYFKNTFFEIFKRPDSRSAPIDGLRAIAILYVVMFHCFLFLQDVFVDKKLFIEFLDDMPFLLKWVWHGDKGVDIFFVLSGFLIGGMLFRDYQREQNLDLKKFYKRRLTRILPLYIFALALYGSVYENNSDYIWANLLFVNNILPSTKIFIPWSWSLTIEVQFYLLIPFILMPILRLQKPLYGIFWLLVLMILLRLAITLHEPILYTKSFADNFLLASRESAFRYTEALYVNLYTRVGPLLMGVVFAYLHVFYAQQIKDAFIRHHVKLQFLYACLAGITLYILFHAGASVPSDHPAFNTGINLLYVAFGRNLFSLFIVLSLAYALYAGGVGFWIRHFLSMRLWYPVAQTSYSMYLFHIPFIAIVYFLVKGADKIQAISYTEIFFIFIGGSLLSVVFGIFTFIFIEKPAIRFGRK